MAATESVIEAGPGDLQALELRPLDGGRACALSVRAQPNARRAGVLGVWNTSLRVAVTARAADGRANTALVETLAELLGLPRAKVAIVAGARARLKTVRLEAAPQIVRARLAEILA
jgi:uncharacterized protein